MNDLASPDANIQTVMLDAVCDALAAAFIVYDRNDLIVFASRQICGYFPIPKNYLEAGTRLRDFLGAIYDSDARYATGEAGKRIVNRDEWIAERIASHWKERSEHVERRGSDRWIRFVKRRLPSGYGICVLKDVSEDKKREEQWRADLERVQLTEEILDSLPFPIFVKDRNFNYVAVNKAVCAMHGKSPDAILGRTIYAIYEPAIADRIDEADRRVMETGTPSVVPERIVGEDGVETLMIVRKYRVGKPGRYFLVTTMEDVTSLTATGLHGECVLPGAGSVQFLDTKIGKGRIAAASRTRDAVERYARRKVLLVTSDLSVEEKALTTLAKLGFEACSVHDEMEQEAFLDIAASVGVRVDLIVVDTQMNVGCLEIAEQYGVDVLALDGFQLGGELVFLLSRHFAARGRFGDEQLAEDELDITPPADPAPQGSEEARSIDVLVAEDNEINQIVFSQILEGLGYSYMIAPNGEEAVRLWQERNPHIVLMDVTLPVLNGFEASVRLREIEKETGGRTPVVGVLSHAFDHDREQCFASGMDDTVLKPISPDIIEALFEKYLPQRSVDVA